MIITLRTNILRFMFRSLLFHRQGRCYPTAPEEIVHIQADDKYSHCFLKNGKKFTEIHCLTHYEKLLASTGLFIKVHRSHIVNVLEIDSYERGEVIMKNGEKINLSDHGLELLNKYFSEDTE